MKSARTIPFRVAAVGAMLAIAGTAQANLLANPSFDDGGGSLAGWTAFGNAYSDTAISLSAPGSAKMFGNFSGGFDVTGIFQAFPTSAGQVWNFSASSFVGSFDPLTGAGAPDFNWAVMKLAFFDAAVGGAEIYGAEVTIADGLSTQDVWTPYSLTGIVAPAGALHVEAFFLFLQPFNDGGSVFVDDAVLTPAPGAAALLGMGGIAFAGRRRR